MYKHITGYNIGGHAVKLIGWGTTDDGEDYWVNFKKFEVKSRFLQRFAYYYF